MGYKLAASNGDTLAVPQLVLTHLTQTDGDTIRAALYILQTHDTDPRTMARALALPSIEAAKRALQYWAGAGLLVSERGAAPAPAAEPARVDLASVANDPYVAVLCQEAQSIFGKTLSRSEMQRLVGLYLNDGWQPDVILLCCAEVTRLGRRTIAAVTHLLARWREDGVETGEDAERWLQRAKQREAWCQEYELEYGKNFLEIHKDAIAPEDKVLIVDDLIATGGTAVAMVKLIGQAGAELVGLGFLLELAGFKPREVVAQATDADFYSLVSVDAK